MYNNQYTIVKGNERLKLVTLNKLAFYYPYLRKNTFLARILRVNSFLTVSFQALHSLQDTKFLEQIYYLEESCKEYSSRKNLQE